jgi:type III pantothenate kinase
VRILAIDAGNSRVKWGLSEGGRWRALGAVPTDEVERLAHDAAWRDTGTPERIAVANVAGPVIRDRLAALLARWPRAPDFLRAAAAACGVTNGYAEPGQLGVDRFAALVAARARHRGDCLVVMAGTATTIDHLDADGLFRGGMILPGARLMKRSLHQGTADLPLEEGEYSEAPRSTADAIETGCREAQVGVVARARARLPRGARCFVTGGAARELVPLLDFPVEEVEHLVLEGIVLLAQ